VTIPLGRHFIDRAPERFATTTDDELAFLACHGAETRRAASLELSQRQADDEESNG